MLFNVSFNKQSMRMDAGLKEVQTINGKDGLSAYEIALKNGFEGTEEEWLESIGGASDEQVEKAVTKYLDEHPVDAGVKFETDATLSLKDGILSVNTATEPEPDNTLPITSAAVYAEVGNINALLETI